METLISNLIRPFRFRYSIFDLGSRQKENYERTDSSIINDRGYKIQYSYYQNKNPSSVCLVYAHCNSGCRIEGLQFVEQIIEQGWNLCLFDFAGSGVSEGEFISLGFYEHMDLQAIISLVIREGNSKIHLWGRSMGAATIILYLSETKQIDAITSCVLDSPYSSLWSAIKEIGRSKTKIPDFIIEHLMEYIRKSIMKEHHFDIKKLELFKKIDKLDLPVMFIASTSDSFVSCSHAEELYKLANSKHKVLEYIDKEHNSPRENGTINTGINFMLKIMREKEKMKKEIKMLSQKKEQCRKLTGNNMAELITKPSSKAFIIKNQSVSTGNLRKQNKFCNKITPEGFKKIHEKVSNPKLKPSNINICLSNVPLEEEVEGKANKENPHIQHQSIIRLALPPQEFLEETSAINENELSRTCQDFMKVRKSARDISEHIEVKNMREMRYRRCNSNNCTVKIEGVKSMVSSMNKENKENNVNIGNKSIDYEESSPIFKSDIKNFSTILTNRFHFNIENQSQNINPNLRDHQILNNQTQKLPRVHAKEGKSVQNGSQINLKPNGIKLFNKLGYKRQKKEEKFESDKARAKTETICMKTEEEEKENEEKKFKIKEKREQISKDKRVIQPLRLLSEESDISVEENFPEIQNWADIKVISYPNKDLNTQNSLISSKKNLRNNEGWITSSQETDLNTKLDSDFKHFLSIGSIDAVNNPTEERKQFDLNCLNKTQKIIKIQIDRNIFKTKSVVKESSQFEMGRLSVDKVHENYAKIGPKQLSVAIPNPLMETNTANSKLKLKNKRMLKISTHETLDQTLF